ncbi:hypothetical protein MCU_01344 [Bartonella elizabethae Re6043vi]|uniref:Uncharacterized protein n=2 Tax=Bartonella elizabethae TaxID=807 RepID=J1KAB9_BAREL|nr:hypothetical protein MCU_01344 [Bartonella elizabethae Re6043vi]EJF94370.1 hypothetical protein MEE_01390 [Bartonella elizabethae F9251 = ATCC 49927]VEJ41954.1 Uncharacterised protein [Bartonella elizabethae]
MVERSFHKRGDWVLSFIGIDEGGGFRVILGDLA